jgi:hypothetical protein
VAQLVALDARSTHEDQEADLARLRSMPGVTPPKHRRVFEPVEPVEIDGEPLSETVLRERR